MLQGLLCMDFGIVPRPCPKAEGCQLPLCLVKVILRNGGGDGLFIIPFRLLKVTEDFLVKICQIANALLILLFVSIVDSI